MCVCRAGGTVLRETFQEGYVWPLQVGVCFALKVFRLLSETLSLRACRGYWVESKSGRSWRDSAVGRY